MTTDALCLGCGLCCSGILFSGAQMRMDEIPRARELGMEVVVTPETGASGWDSAYKFRQPCPCHQDGRCSAYENRLSVCRAYQCRLLERYQRWEVTLAQALGQVRKVEAALEMLAPRLGPRPAGQSAWDWIVAWRESERVGTSEESCRRHGDTLLQIAALAMLLEQEFGVGKAGDSLPV